MIKVIAKILNKFSKVKNIREAIHKIADKELTNHLKEDIAEEDIIYEVAKLANQSTEDVYGEVAKLLDMTFLSTLHHPTKELIELTGVEVEVLKSIPALPQISKNKEQYCILAVSSIERISIADFRNAGIEIVLADKEQIQKHWEHFESIVRIQRKVEVQDSLLDIIENLLSSLKSHRVRTLEIFNDYYTFVSKGTVFKGSLNKELFDSLTELLEVNRSFSFKSRMFKSLIVEKSTHKNSLIVKWKTSNKKSQSHSQLLSENLVKQEKSKILLVEDNQTYRSIISNILREKGFDVCSKANGDEALKFLASDPFEPDLIVCDVHMPIMTGPEFVQKMRNFGANMPILMLTSDEDSSTEVHLANLGADACIRKSEDPSVLIAWCRRLTRKLAIISNNSSQNLLQAYK